MAVTEDFSEGSASLGAENKLGVIYVATGKDYLDLAIDSAESLRRTNPNIAIDLFTDATNIAPSNIFSEIHKIDNPHDRSKLDCMPLSRFERTLFLDCDTRVIAPIGDLFDLLDQFDLAMAHDVRRKSDLIREGWQERTPYCFPQLNSGVVLYTQSPAMRDFFIKWKESYVASGANRDQISLKDLLWRTDIRFYVLPPEFNLRRVTLLDAWEPLDIVPTIIHSHIFLQHLRVPGTKKITDISELIEIERNNLQLEWDAEGKSNVDTRWWTK